MQEIKEPEDTGSLGTQESGEDEFQTPEVIPALKGSDVSNTLQGLASTGTKRFGGEVAAKLLVTSISLIETQLHETKEELKQSRTDNKDLTKELSHAKTCVAVLKERIMSIKGSRKLVNIAITCGTILLGVAVELFRNNYNEVSVISAIIGLIFIGLGWIPESKEAEK